MANQIVMISKRGERYEASNGLAMQREYGQTPNGNPMNGRWVLRDHQGMMLDFNQYRNDLADQYNLKLID